MENLKVKMKKASQKLPSDLILDIKTRLKTLSGQINGIVKMLDEGKDPEHINIQFKSIDKGIQKAHYWMKPIEKHWLLAL